MKQLLAIAGVFMLAGATFAGPLADGREAYGRGDYADAAVYFLKAAEEGDAIAQVRLGLMYRKGKGVPRDDAEAARWYRRAAEQGDPVGQNHLALMYAYGKGVRRNDVLAHMWWILAAAQGAEDAGANRDKIAKRMTRQQIADAQKLAREWKPIPKR
jgi:TPR repeat protein